MVTNKHKLKQEINKITKAAAVATTTVVRYQQDSCLVLNLVNQAAVAAITVVRYQQDSCLVLNLVNTLVTPEREGGEG